MELLVAATIGLVLVGLTHAVVLSNHRLYQYDLVRLALNQNLRSAMDIVSSNVREAGERLPAEFPSVEIIDGGAGLPDELILRRNLLDEVLVVCADIASGSTGSAVALSSATAVNPACTYPSQQNSFDTWQQYRLDEGGTVTAYIYDQATKVGEFFTYNTEANSGGSMSINRLAGSWVNDYSEGFSAVYILTKWQFSLNADLLQVVENDEAADPLNIVFGLNDFQLQAFMQDGTIKTSFTTTDSWTDLQAIEVTLAGQDAYKDQIIDAQLQSHLFPRNILSN